MPAGSGGILPQWYKDASSSFRDQKAQPGAREHYDGAVGPRAPGQTGSHLQGQTPPGSSQLQAPTCNGAPGLGLSFPP